MYNHKEQQQTLKLVSRPEKIAEEEAKRAEELRISQQGQQSKRRTSAGAGEERDSWRQRDAGGLTTRLPKEIIARGETTGDKGTLVHPVGLAEGNTRGLKKADGSRTDLHGHL